MTVRYRGASVRVLLAGVTMFATGRFTRSLSRDARAHGGAFGSDVFLAENSGAARVVALY